VKWIKKHEASLENILDLIEFALEQLQKAMRGEILYEGEPIEVNLFVYFNKVKRKACFAGIAHYVATGKPERSIEDQFALCLLDGLRFASFVLLSELEYAQSLGLVIPDTPSGHSSYNVNSVMNYVEELLKSNGRLTCHK
jgi:hypothetical protein